MAWAGGGGQAAWANQVDEEEEQGGTLGPAARPPPAQGPVLGDPSFPSLGEATKQPRKKRERTAKPGTMSLAEFNQGGPAPSARAPGGAGQYLPPSQRGGPTAAIDKVVLPTGPRERAPDDDGRGRTFGGAGRYGGPPLAIWPPLRGWQPVDWGRAGRDRDDDADQDSMPREDMGPSRADMSDNWGASRATAPPLGGGGGGGGSFGASRFGSRSGDGGAGAPGSFREYERTSRGGGFDDAGGRSFGQADTESRWSRRPSEAAAPMRTSSGGGGWAGRPSEGGAPVMGERPRCAPAALHPLAHRGRCPALGHWAKGHGLRPVPSVPSGEGPLQPAEAPSCAG